jgi:glucuronosyltransferase
MIFGGCHRYRENAQRLHHIFWDQPLTPLKQAVYWTEYVIRHKGALHLRSAVMDLAWYKYYLLDVIAVLALAVGSVVLVVYMAVTAMLDNICGSGRQKDDNILRNKKSN